MRALLVVNPCSRLGNAIAEDARRELEARGVEVLAQSQDGSSGMPAYDCIVAAGGDGTLVRLIGRAIAANVPVGIIPGGTFNELARTLAIPLDVAAACDVIAAARTRLIDVGRVNGVYYINEASIGISSRAARLQTTELKQRYGFFAVAASALRALTFARPMFAEVSYGETVVRFRTVQLTIANNQRFGGLFSVSDAAIDDGWLDLYSIEIQTFWEAFRVAQAILAGRRQSVPGLRTLRSSSFRVRQHRAHHITADGEPAGTTPATFEVLPKALRVFVAE
ncbi:MAG: YegS/Rv2252/BmrU family lipid kinase [Candidatus Eremiobacteraeota bacterium]|nr:YegS/Rv2252/BmrU family lipid kinase [Candidatus Eremiobacteraeota bacterium]